MLAVPAVSDLAGFSGRPEASYTSYANSALIQAVLMLTTVTELTPDSFSELSADDQALAFNGILAMADYIYLRQGYQAIIASPLMNETIGSYSYAKAEAQVARNAAALSLTAEKTGVVFYDLAVQFLARRTRAGGVYSGAITVFEDGSRRYDGAVIELREKDGRLVLLGPSQFDQVNTPFDVNGQSFPADPGV